MKINFPKRGLEPWTSMLRIWCSTHWATQTASDGEDDKVVLRSVEYWDPSTRIWKTLNCLPFAVSKHGLVVSGQGKMYMSGGEYPDGSASRSMWRYDPVLDKWEEMAGMRVPRSELGLAMLDGCVYAVGGWEVNKLFNIGVNEWINKQMWGWVYDFFYIDHIV